MFKLLQTRIPFYCLILILPVAFLLLWGADIQFFQMRRLNKAVAEKNVDKISLFLNSNDTQVRIEAYDHLIEIGTPDAMNLVLTKGLRSNLRQGVISSLG